MHAVWWRASAFLGNGDRLGQHCSSPGLAGAGQLGGGCRLRRCDLEAGLLQGLRPQHVDRGIPQIIGWLHSWRWRTFPRGTPRSLIKPRGTKVWGRGRGEAVEWDNWPRDNVKQRQGEWLRWAQYRLQSPSDLGVNAGPPGSWL